MGDPRASSAGIRFATRPNIADRQCSNWTRGALEFAFDLAHCRIGAVAFLIKRPTACGLRCMGCHRGTSHPVAFLDRRNRMDGGQSAWMAHGRPFLDHFFYLAHGLRRLRLWHGRPPWHGFRFRHRIRARFGFWGRGTRQPQKNKISVSFEGGLCPSMDGPFGYSGRCGLVGERRDGHSGARRLRGGGDFRRLDRPPLGYSA